MKSHCGFLFVLSMFVGVIVSPEAGAQSLSGSLGFSIEGSFINGTAAGSNAIMIADDDLTNGYAAGFDLKDAPSGLTPTGPQGSAAFQWGEAASTSAYPHTSALWFQPLTVGNVAPEQSFEFGTLHYRNGTIKSDSTVGWVDLALTLTFSQPLGQDPVSVIFGSELINTVNSKDPIASADIVSLRNPVAPVDFTDAQGNRYFLELSFQVDQETLDGTLSTPDQFQVFEGGSGSATLLGRFTTMPSGDNGTPMVPEPSAAMIGALGMLFLLRRRR